MIKIDFIEKGGPDSNRESNFCRSQEERLKQREAAERFLITGNQLDWEAAPPYGKEWNRDYNTTPYPEAVPTPEDMYDGTGIGFLYGIDHEAKDSLRVMYALDMAGWNLVREGAEVFRSETKVDKKELVPPGDRV